MKRAVRTRALPVVLLAAIFGVLGVSIARAPEGLRIADPVDLRAFRCAVLVQRDGGDPYRVEPLRTCERDAEAVEGVRSMASFTVIPVPLPPYAFALYAPFAFVGPNDANTGFLVLSIAALAALAFALSRLGRVSIAASIVVAVAGVWFPSVFQGQPVVFVVLALVVAALAVRTRRRLWAAVALVAASVSPHLIVPSLVALAVQRRTRIVALGTVVALFALLAPFGYGRTVEYVTRELPAHALSEIRWFGGQFGMANALVAAGLAPHVALACSGVAWGLALVVAVWYARRLADAYDDPALLVVLPAALCLPFVAYLHATWLGFALPGALALCGRKPARRFALCAVALLSVPWNALGQALLPDRLASGFGYAYVAPASGLASDAWRGFIDAFAAANLRPIWLNALIKLPTWLGYASLWCATVACARALRAQSGSALARAQEPVDDRISFVRGVRPTSDVFARADLFERLDLE